MIISFSLLLISCEGLNQEESPTTVIESNPTLTEEPTITEPLTEPEPTIQTEPVANPLSFDRLFDDSKMKHIQIEISEDEWNQLDQEMIFYYNQFGNYRTDYYAKANFKFTDDLGEVHVLDIGFRTRGNTSRVRIQDDFGNPQLSHFKISFHEDFNNPEYLVNKDRTVFDVEELDMKYNRNYDSTYVTEMYSYNLFNQMGVVAPETTLAFLSIKIGDDVYDYGVYTLIEPIDKEFLKRRYTKDGNDGNLFKALWQHYGPAALQLIDNPQAIGIKDESINYRPAYDLKTNKKTYDVSDLLDFIEQINTLNGSEFQTYIEANFEVDQYLRLMAVGVLLGNPDDYRAMGNNYFLYHHNLTDKWVMIPYDYDHGLGQGWDGGPVFSNHTIGADIYEWGNLNQVFLGVNEYPHPLSDKILQIESYQLLYESYLEQLIDPEENLFSFEAFYAIYNEQKLLYRDMIGNAMMNLGFNRRNTEWYFNAKIEDIQDQIAYYQSHPQDRGF